jgi:hypothetical protein
MNDSFQRITSRVVSMTRDMRAQSVTRFFRFRLLTYLVAALTVGTIIGLAGRWYFHCPSYTIKDYRIDRTRILTAWRVQGGTQSLEYAVFIPRGMDSSYSMMARRAKPRKDGVSLRDDLLYMNALPIDTSGPCPFFIYTPEQTLVKMDMTESECRSIEANGFENLGGTRLWKEKLLPQLRKSGVQP